MKIPRRSNRSHALFAAVFVTLLAAGCGSNAAQLVSDETNTGGTTNENGVPVPAAFLSSTSQPTTIGQPTVVPATGSAYGYTAAASLPNATTLVTVTDTVSNAPIGSETALSMRGRAPLGVRDTLAFQGTTIDYLTVTANNTVSFTGVPTFTFAIPYIPTGGYNLYLAEYVNGTWNGNYATPAISGTTLTFTGPSGTIALGGTNSLQFALYALPTADTPEPFTGT